VKAGINPERFALDWASAAEASLFVKLITNFTNHIMKLGPLGHHEGITLQEMKSNLAGAKAAVENVRLRTRIAKLVQDMRKSDDYSSHLIEAKMSEKLDAVIMREIEKHGKAMEESRTRNAR
jgi:hypothetical protein